MSERRSPGERVRRAVLGDAHVELARERAGEFGAPFQDFITEHAWGAVWTRPGLDRAERSLVTIALLAALGHEAELAMHVRGGLRGGLTPERIREVLIQVAVYAGAPVANRAFPVAQRVVEEMRAAGELPAGESTGRS